MPGSIIDGGAFAGDSPVATDWYTRIGALTWDGNQTVYDGAVISIFASARPASRPPSAHLRAPSIDGFDLRGGDQQGFPGNINAIGGGTDRPARQPGHPGRRHLRQRLRPQPPDQQQRGPEQRRRLRHASASARPTCRARHQQPQRQRAHRQQPDHRQRRHQPGRRHRPLRRRRQLRGRRQRHLRQLLGRVRRRPQRLRLQPRRPDPPQPDLLQPVLRRGRRRHDRRRSCRPTPPRSRPAPGRWTSTTTSSRPTSPTTTAAACAS